MKLRIMLSGLLLLGLQACAQVTPPQAVKDAFQQKFPDAKKVDWGKEDANEYEAEFKLMGTEMSANFDEQGNWMETETGLKKKEVPAEVMKAMQENFPSGKFNELAKIEKPDGKTYYEAEVEQNEKTTEALFDGSGKMVSKKVLDEEDEEND